VFSVISLGQAPPLYLPALAGALLLPIPPLVIADGAADAAGALNLPVPLPSLPPGVQAIAVYAQAAAVSAIGCSARRASSRSSSGLVA
jgi:hypothetical protein